MALRVSLASWGAPEAGGQDNRSTPTNRPCTSRPIDRPSDPLIVQAAIVRGVGGQRARRAPRVRKYQKEKSGV